MLGAGRGRHLDPELAGLEAALPRQPEVAFTQAYLALRQGNAAAAARSARRALELRDSYPAARLVLAEALLGLGRLDDARSQMQAFLAESGDGDMAAERQRVSTFLARE